MKYQVTIDVGTEDWYVVNNIVDEFTNACSSIKDKELRTITCVFVDHEDAFELAGEMISLMSTDLEVTIKNVM